jgi:outer membrane protein assembly factor BamB
MKQLLAALGVVALAAAGLAQRPVRVFTRPEPPPREVLDRLHLTQAWRVKIPTQSQRDGIFSIQIIPYKDRYQVVVQTYYGSVLLLDAETGDTLWRTSVGVPYWEGQPVAYNSSSIFATRREYLYVLNRATGAQRVFTLDKDSKLPHYGYRMHFAPSAMPVADEESIVLCFENRVSAYELPIWSLIDRARPEPKPDSKLPDADKHEESLQPEFLWSHLTANYHFEQPPQLTASQVGVVTTDGTFQSLTKFAEARDRVRYDYQFNRDVSTAMGQHGVMAYIGSDDFTLYALNMVNGRLMWRYLSGAPIRRQPVVTDRDVFVTSVGRGMARVDRDNGEPRWRNRQAEKFLAANQKFVYALDRRGRLLVLDHARGVEMAHYDMNRYVLPVSNELTDRIYFGNHDGQVLCLHMKDNIKPLVMKTLETKKPPPLPKEEEKEKEKEKDKEKEKEKEKEDKEEKKPDKAPKIQKKDKKPEEAAERLQIFGGRFELAALQRDEHRRLGWLDKPMTPNKPKR